DTNFWQVFDESQYDLIQTAKAGPKEYPYYRMKKPVVEYVTLSAGVDFSPSIVWTIHLSEWQRKEWGGSGGNLHRSSVIPIPADPPASSKDFRDELGILQHAVVAGFHQRPDDNIASPTPLNASNAFQGRDTCRVIVGGRR